MAEKQPPDTVDGTPVEASGEPLATSGGRWVTLVPTDYDDERLWEFDVDSGRIVRTM